MAPTCQQVTLLNGRILSYAEYGDPNGSLIFFFHGWPSSRLHGKRINKVVKKLKIRVIAPDRPGIGYSEFQENRTLLDWPNDIEELADKLNHKSFSVMGVSGGGPYAAVCAYKLPKRVRTTGIIVGLAPPYIPKICTGMAWANAFSWSRAYRYPIAQTIAGYLVFLQATILRYDLASFFLSNADKRLMSPTYKNSLLQDRIESLRQGTRGLTHDLNVYCTNWNFDLEKIRVPVFLWYGARDKNVSLSMGEYYHSRIKGSKLHIYSEGGHFSWLEDAQNILKTLII